MRLIDSGPCGAEASVDQLGFLDDIMCDAWSSIANELENHLRHDPEEIGWSEWWRGFIRLATAVQVVNNLKQAVEETLQPKR